MCSLYYMSVAHLPDNVASLAHFTAESSSNSHQNFDTDLLLESDECYRKGFQTGHNGDIGRRERCRVRVDHLECRSMPPHRFGLSVSPA